MSTATLKADGRVASVADLAPQADQFLDVLSSVRRSARVLADRPVELSTLTAAQLELMRLVLRQPGISVAQAADELHLAPNTVSTLVRQLTGQELLVRRVDEADRRVARLELTAAMQRKVGQFLDRRVAMVASALGQLSPAKQRIFANAMVVLDELADLLRLEESAHA